MLRTFAEIDEALAPYIAQTPAALEAYTLERVERLMAALGNPQKRYKVVHVAGTSGKTSTSYYLAAMLRQTGCKVGLTISPHMDQVNERVQINLVPLPEAEFGRELTAFLPLVEATGLKVSYFELVVAFAYWEFARQKVDYAVIEVGLGGLKDATNVLQRSDKVCVITDIGIDHAQVLGDTVTAIAAQKAGIIHSHNDVFMHRQAEEILTVVQKRCRQESARLHLVPAGAVTGDLPRFQRRNWRLARTVSEFVISRDKLPALSEAAWQATQSTYVPGRMEVRHLGDTWLVLDGAHNPQKMAALAASLRERFGDRPMVALLGFKAGKDIPGALTALQPLVSHAITTEFNVSQDSLHRSVPADELMALCRELGIAAETGADSAAALRRLLGRPEPVLVVTGSLYLIHQIRQLLGTP